MWRAVIDDFKPKMALVGIEGFLFSSLSFISKQVLEGGRVPTIVLGYETKCGSCQALIKASYYWIGPSYLPFSFLLLYPPTLAIISPFPSLF